MKEENFQIFLTALLAATERISETYFRLPVTYQEYVYRERAYCYELYHHLRLLLPDGFPYVVSGEIHKGGHPIADFCGPITPDFLVHNPGHMGKDDNLVILEVKTIQGANYQSEDCDLLKDMNTINCMTTLENGYYRGLLLVFGAGYGKKKAGIHKAFNARCNPDTMSLLFHENSMTMATIA